MNNKDTLLIDGKEHVTIKKFISMGECHWTHSKTVENKIHNESFPATKRGKYWWIDLNAARLWFKRRDKEAS